MMTPPQDFRLCDHCGRRTRMVISVMLGVFTEEFWCPTCIVQDARGSAFPRCECEADA